MKYVKEDWILYQLKLLQKKVNNLPSGNSGSGSILDSEEVEVLLEYTESNGEYLLTLASYESFVNMITKMLSSNITNISIKPIVYTEDGIKTTFYDAMISTSMLEGDDLGIISFIIAFGNSSFLDVIVNVGAGGGYVLWGDIGYRFNHINLTFCLNKIGNSSKGNETSYTFDFRGKVVKESIDSYLVTDTDIINRYDEMCNNCFTKKFSKVIISADNGVEMVFNTTSVTYFNNSDTKLIYALSAVVHLFATNPINVSFCRIENLLLIAANDDVYTFINEECKVTFIFE